MGLLGEAGTPQGFKFNCRSLELRFQSWQALNNAKSSSIESWSLCWLVDADPGALPELANSGGNSDNEEAALQKALLEPLWSSLSCARDKLA